MIVTTSELLQFTYPCTMIVQPSISRVISIVAGCFPISSMPWITIFTLCLPQFKAMQIPATHTTGPILVTPAVWFPSGSDLPCNLCVTLNRLRTGVDHCDTCLYCWGMLDTPKCICGAEGQSANNIIFYCNILRRPNFPKDLRSPNINNTKWLEDHVHFVWTAAHTQEEDCNC